MGSFGAVLAAPRGGRAEPGPAAVAPPPPPFEVVGFRKGWEYLWPKK